MSWRDRQTSEARSVTAPLTLVISAFATVRNIHNTWTPALKRKKEVGESVLIYVDLAQGHRALGGSAIAQVFDQSGNEAPDLRDGKILGMK